MTTEERIADLLALAAPLREMHDDDPAKEPLGGIIDQINRLREQQDKERRLSRPEAPELSVREKLEAAGIKVDKRWSDARCHAELEKAKK